MILLRYRKTFLQTVFCAMAPDDGEAELGPGGVSTPTPEPGPTPTPQPEPEKAAEGAPLKPVAELLGKKPEEKAEVKEGDEIPPEPAKPTAAEARINALTAEKWNEKRGREAAEARAKLAEETLAELQRLGTVTPKDGETPPAPKARTFTAAEVEAEAARLAAQGEFNKQVDKVVLDGRAAHKDYDEAIAGLKSVTGPVVPAEFIAAAMETGEASELIYHLGRNAAEADRILSLPVVKQAVALEKLASELRTQRIVAAAAQVEPEVSKAPKPITPRVGGRAAAEPNLETMSMADYIKTRNEQERAARATRH